MLHCQPWSRLHFNFAGPMFNMYLVVVDAHTKWIEVFPMSKSTSFTTLQTPFAQIGIPQTVVTDNGTCFASDEFRDFMDKNGIHHIHCSPYHWGFNGLAEHSVSVSNSLNVEGISTPPFINAEDVHN